MIYTFHKVSNRVESPWFVSSDYFRNFLTRISSKQVVYLDDYDPSNDSHVVISFDGVYEDVVTFALPYLVDRALPFECFVIGNFIGKTNAFDKGEPLTNFCSLDQLEQLVEGGGRIQWHTNTHQDLSRASLASFERELQIPQELSSRFRNGKHLRHFAFPHGKVSANQVEIVKENFVSALGSDDASTPRKTDLDLLPRKSVFEGDQIDSPSLGVVVANYNYGHLLSRAVQSLELQTFTPNAIHISDDASTDGSYEILSSLGQDYEVFFNNTNLGIVDHFNLAVRRLNTDYVLILGADNELRSDALEQMYRVLGEEKDVAICYSDMLVFGPDSDEYARRVDMEKICDSSATNSGVYLRAVPDFEDVYFSPDYFPAFINGSSMFRRDQFEKVGGYKETYPEDHNLWHRMLMDGAYKARRVPGALLRYRQHSGAQASNVLYLYAEISRLRSQNAKLHRQLSKPMRAFLEQSLQFLLTPSALALRRTILSDKLHWVRMRARLNRYVDHLPRPIRRVLYGLAVRVRS